MNRKTVIAFVVFVGLGLLALFALRQPQKGERAADHPNPIPALDTAQFDTLEVTKAGVTTVIKSEGGKYKVTAPVSYPADAAAAKAAFEGLGKLRLSDLVTDQKPKQAEFEVDDKGIHVVVKKGDKPLADFVVGKAVGAGTMVRPSGKDEIWQAGGINRYVFDKTPVDWRDKSITTFTAADAERVEVATREGAKIAVKKTGAKQGSEDKWEVVDSSVKIDKLDDSVPNGIVSALAVWKANDFGDGMSAASAGLDPAAVNVTVTLKGGKKVVALLGDKPKGKEDEVYVKVPDAPQVYIAKKYNVERVNKRPIEFRDKTLCNLADSDIAEIAVTRGDNSFTLAKTGNDWKAVKPAKLDLDASKVTPIAGAFKDWKATSFADDSSPKDDGLAKPRAVIAVKGKDKSAGCLIKVGDESKDKLSSFVMTGKGPDIYLAPKWTVDRILVKVDDLKKTTTAKK
jgi:hypothetical protein